MSLVCKLTIWVGSINITISVVRKSSSIKCQWINNLVIHTVQWMWQLDLFLEKPIIIHHLAKRSTLLANKLKLLNHLWKRFTQTNISVATGRRIRAMSFNDRPVRYLWGGERRRHCRLLLCDYTHPSLTGRGGPEATLHQVQSVLQTAEVKCVPY